MLRRISQEGASSSGAGRADAIAIIGIGCRYPGGIDGPEAFWRLLLDGRDAIREAPAERRKLWDACGSRSTDAWHRHGGFLDRVDEFDASFFGISPREAESLDPQQRLLMEVAWEALEDAGQTRDHLQGSATGVFVGLWTSDYESVLTSNLASVDFYGTQGTGRYTASGRLSYWLGLQGPSLTVDTACSSSLLAVHLALQSLRQGECATALVGGANLILQPHISAAYGKSGMLSPEGRCKFGDAEANGYVRSEGAAIVMLKPLAAAVEDGDPVYAVIHGSSVGNEGRSGDSFGTPSRSGQRRMLQAAYADAGIPLDGVQYVEAHGTGTRVGDPTELGAIADVVCRERAPDQPLYVGSVKSNFGHAEAAAGVAGLIKAALVLQHRTVPANLHLRTPNPRIEWHRSPLQIPTHRVELAPGLKPLYAGVNSFGISGTNVHVVLGSVPPLQRAARPVTTQREIFALPLTAHDEAALKQLAERYADYLEESRARLEDVCYTAACRRTHHAHRLVVSGKTRSELIEKLRDFSYGRTAADTPVGVALMAPATHHRASMGRLAWAFSGQGSQWPRMGMALLARESVFRESLQAFSDALEVHVGWSLIDELAVDSESSRLETVEVMWPAIVGVEIALARLWLSRGLEPSVVVGHSIGEVAAAHVAGALSLEDSACVIAHMGRLVQEASGPGGMLYVSLNREGVEADVAPWSQRVAIAVEASPRGTVLAGDREALAEIEALYERRGVLCRSVRTEVAAHSAHLDFLRQPLLAAIGHIRPQASSVPFCSTVEGQILGGEALGADYWWQNVRRKVKFREAIEQLLVADHRTFLEISPHPVVASSIQQTAAESAVEVTVVGSMMAEDDEAKQFSEASRILSPWLQPNVIQATSTSHNADNRGPVFVFSGQGPQWCGMGRELLEREPVFRRKLEEIDELLQPMSGWSLLEELTTEDQLSRISETLVAQPAIFAVQVALTHLLGSWGIRPGAAVGHSVGEIAAAHAAGVLSLQEAVRVVFHRASLMQRATGLGKMVAVEASPVQVSRELAEHLDRLSLAAHNAPDSVVLSGDETALADAVDSLEQRGLRCAYLPVNYAFHSPQMQPFRAQLTSVLGEISLDPAVVPLISTVTGRWATARDYDAAYWGRNVRQPVQFCAAIEQLIQDGHRTFVELAPHPVLSGYISRIGADSEIDCRALPTLVRGSSARQDLLTFVARLFVTGEAFDWTRILPESRCVRLPTYVWQRQRHWHELKNDRPDGSQSSPNLNANSLLGRRLPVARLTYQTELSGPMIRGSAGYRDRFAPPSFFLRLAEAAANELGVELPLVVGNLNLPDPCVIPAEEPLRLQTAISERTDQGWSVEWHVQPLKGQQETWQSVGHADLIPHHTLNGHVPGSLDIAQLRSQMKPLCAATSSPLAACWNGLALDQIWQSPSELLAELASATEGGADIYGLFDLGLSYLASLNPETCFRRGLVGRVNRAAIVSAKQSAHWLYVRSDRERDGDVGGMVSLHAADGSCIAYASGVKLSLQQETESAECNGANAARFRIAWQEVMRSASTVRNRLADRWIILGNCSGLTSQLAAVLRAKGYPVEVRKVVECGEQGATNESYVNLLDECAALEFVNGIATSDLPVQGIVYCPDRSDHADKLTDVDRHFRKSVDGAEITLNLVKALEACDWRNEPRFFLLTQGASSIDRKDTQLDPTHAALCGLLRVARNECSSVRFVSVDLSSTSSQDELECVCEELLAPVEEAELAVRGNRMYAPALVRDDSLPTMKAIASPEATYLISGGVGALGIRCAKWLVDSGARHLVLFARRPPAADAGEAIAELARAGANVLVLAADVTDQKDLQELRRRIPVEWPPIRGVLHAAGAVEDCILLRQSRLTLEKVFAPKIKGALCLAAEFQEAKLDSFVLFSSISALTGTSGQANYAAANAYQDALAGWLRSVNVPATSVGFGPWDTAGMAALLGPEERRRWSERGLEFLSPVSALQALNDVLASGLPYVAVVASKQMRIEVCRVAPLPHASLPVDPVSSRPHMSVTQLASASHVPKGLSGRQVLDVVRSELLSVLRLAHVEIDTSRGFKELGLDSLMALEFRNRLQDAFQCRLPATITFDHPTPRQLAEFVFKRIQGQSTYSNQRQLLGRVRCSQQGRNEIPVTSDTELLREFN